MGELEISAEDLSVLLRAPGRAPLLLDVRQPEEHVFAALAGSALIPLDELVSRLDELELGRPVVAYCHHGVRSLQAAAFLRTRGFADARSLAGGIDRWSRVVDASVPRY